MNDKQQSHSDEKQEVIAPVCDCFQNSAGPSACETRGGGFHMVCKVVEDWSVEFWNDSVVSLHSRSKWRRSSLKIVKESK